MVHFHKNIFFNLQFSFANFEHSKGAIPQSHFCIKHARKPTYKVAMGSLQQTNLV
jgi:hypothetical protein